MLRGVYFHFIYWLIVFSVTGAHAATAHSPKTQNSTLSGAFTCEELAVFEKTFLQQHFLTRHGVYKKASRSESSKNKLLAKMRKKAFEQFLGVKISSDARIAQVYKKFIHQVYVQKDCSALKTLLDRASTLALDSIENKKNHQCRIKRLQRKKAQLTPSNSLEVYLNIFAAALDPHSRYLSPKEAQELFDSVNGESKFMSIGVEFISKDCEYIVVDIQPNSSAKQSGLQRGDVILEIAPKGDREFQKVDKLDKTAVLELLVGIPHSVLSLRVKKMSPHNPKATKILELQLKRDEALPPAKKVQLEFRERIRAGKTTLIGVIHLPYFNLPSPKQMAKAIEKAQERGVQALVLNLQNNPGGGVYEALDIVGMFLKSANLLREFSNQDIISTKTDTRPWPMSLEAENKIALKYKGPLVILTDRLSASASEIVSGILKDYSRALIIGDSTTYGKGSIQLTDLSGSFEAVGALQTTVDLYFLPSGNTPQGKGVTSDIVLPTIMDSIKFGEKHKENFIKPFTIAPFLSTDREAGFEDGYHKVTLELKTQLKTWSQRRGAIYQVLEKAATNQNFNVWQKLRIQEAVSIAADMAALHGER